MVPAYTLILLVTVQAAPSPADIADAKCVGALTKLEQQASEADRPGIQALSMYFLGKIVGRSGDAAASAAIKAAGAEMRPQGEDWVPAMAEQCSAELARVTQRR